MNFLKYYSFGFIAFDLILSIYEYGKKEDILSFIISIVCIVPILIYLILS